MWSECSECDRPASQFHGKLPYCSRCYSRAAREDPDANKCIKCGEAQGPQIMWKRDTPCAKCQQMDGQS